MLIDIIQQKTLCCYQTEHLENKMIWLLLAIILLGCLPVAIIGCWQFYLHFINRHTPYGTDKTMVEWGVKIPVINGFQFKLDQHWPEYYQHFVQQVAILFNEPQSPLKVYFDKDTKRYQYHQNLSLAMIFEECEDRSQCNKLYLADHLSLVIRTAPKQGWISFIWDHACFDGGRLYNEVLSPLLALKAYLPPKQLRYYFPFYTEYHMIRLILQYRPALNYKPYTTFQNYEEQYICFFKFNNTLIKKLKNKYQATMADIILSLYCWHLFQLSKDTKKQLNIGLLIACDNPRFRNNYTLVIISIQRSTLFKDIIKQAIAQKANLAAMQAMYNMLTLAATQNFIKNNILDMLLSPFFFQSKLSFSKQIDSFEFMNIPTSSPIYSLYISYKNEVHISATINTPDLNPHKLKRLSSHTIPYQSLT